MKVLTASRACNKESYLSRTADVLKLMGHQIIPFSAGQKFLAKDGNLLRSKNMRNGFIKKEILRLERIYEGYERTAKFSKLLDLTNPDMVWGYETLYPQSFYAEAYKKKIPVVYTFSEGFGGKIFSGQECLVGAEKMGKKMFLREPVLDRAVWEGVDRFVVSSRYLKDIAYKRGVSESKISHVPDYVDTERYTPEYESQPYAVYFGELCQERELPVLLEAMKGLKYVKLYVAGDGPEKKTLARMKEEKHLMNVCFIEKPDRYDLLRLLKGARLVVVPSSGQVNSSDIILKSFALGKPVLGADIAEIPEYVRDGMDGMLFRHDCAQKLAEKLNFMISQPQICREMGMAGRYKVEIEHNQDVFYENVMKVLSRVS